MTSEQKYKQLGADYHWQWARAGDANPYVRWLRRVLAHLPEAGQGATLLDWGCGDGYPASLLAARGYDVTGVDVYGPALDVARERVPGGRFTLPSTDLPEVFDYVLAFEAIEHMADPTLLVAAVKGCARLALITCPARGLDAYAMREYTTEALVALFAGCAVEVLVDEGEHRLFKITQAQVEAEGAPEPAPKRGKRATRRAE